MSFDMEQLLQETNTFMREHGVDMLGDYPTILSEDSTFDLYINSLAEGIEDPMVKHEFMQLSENIRQGLLIETVYGFSPQAPLVLPVFRKFWPNLVAREACTVIPMDRPELVRYFMYAIAKVGSREVALPHVGTDDIISGGTRILGAGGAPYTVAVPSSHDILAAFALTSATAHLERDVQITSVTYDDGGVTTKVNMVVVPDESGDFHFEVDCGGGFTDHVSGHIDFFNGDLSLSGTRSAEVTNKVISVEIDGSLTGAEEMYANKIELKHQKLHINALSHEIQANWTIMQEQDVQAYFNLSMQAYLTDTFSKVIGLDIDKKIINAMYNAAYRHHPAAIKSFDLNPPVNYHLGKREWLSQIALPLNDVSTKIYSDTLIGTANIIIGHPVDVALLRSTGNYSFKGNVKDGGGMGRENSSSFVLEDSWKVLSSTEAKQGKLLVVLKTNNPEEAVWLFAPYRPLTITPFPIGRKPSMSFISRYASQAIRNEGLGVLELNNN